MRYIGLDVGFGYTKAMDQTKTILFPSVISQPLASEFKRLWADLSGTERTNHLAVTLDGENRYVGNLALYQSQYYFLREK